MTPKASGSPPLSAKSSLLSHGSSISSPNGSPIKHKTYLDRLSVRYEREGEPNMLAPVDVFVSMVDPMKEPPLVTANTILSILAMDYPLDKISCYISDDGASMLPTTDHQPSLLRF
ncbi:hypothetical protein K1719_038441 [Acacia pycnantha]|nr:hypothetical protein K1719_038441 [Acacia pycnantha]